MSLPDDPRANISRIVAKALSEIIGNSGLTATAEDALKIIGATIVAQESSLVGGRRWVDEVFAQLDDTVHIDWYIVDGESAEAGDVICKLVGPAQAFLLGERSALTYLKNLSSTTDTDAKPAEFSMNLKID